MHCTLNIKFIQLRVTSIPITMPSVMLKETSKSLEE